MTSARQSLQSLKTAPGSHLQSLMDRYDDVAEEYRLETGETAITVRMTEYSLLQSHSAANQFLQAVCDNLAARFPSLNVVDCLAVFDPRNLPEAGTDELDVYGSESIRQLVEHFNPQFAVMDGQEELDVLAVKMEWVICRSLMSTCYRSLSMQDFLTAFFTRHAATLTQIKILIAIAATLPASTAGCERGIA